MNSINDIIRRIREGRILQERADYKNMDHKDLVRLGQDGDQLAIETLISEYQPAIDSVASKFILDSGDKDDIKQIATIAFWEAIQSWEMEGSFGAYANMIMKRKLTDELRKDSTGKANLNNQASSLNEPVNGDEDGESSVIDTIPSKESSPEEQYLGTSGAKEIMNFMKDKFSQTERDVVLMYIKGYKVSDIADETGMKYKSVENALMRVKNKLADYLRTRESKKIKESKIEDENIDKLISSLVNKIESDFKEGVIE